MSPEEELKLALAELATAEAELAAIKAGNLPKQKRQSKSKPKRRPVHHPESGLRHGIWGDGGPTPSSYRTRLENMPVVTKQFDPTDRPTRGRMPGKVSVRVYNDAGQQEGLAMTMTEREADKLEASLPFGWSITSHSIR